MTHISQTKKHFDIIKGESDIVEKPSMLSVVRRQSNIISPPIEKPIIGNGSDMELNSSWGVWIHKNSSQDWSMTGYENIMTIKTVSDFWSFINNFNKLNYADYQFFIMRDTITPTWEDLKNKFGGAASIKLNVTDPCLLSLWEKICLQMVCEKLYRGNTLSTDINGASFNLKDTTTIIKIWNNDSHNDLIKKLSVESLNNKYKIIYIKNRPDH